ncbi:MAG: hypothetical protein P8Y11_08300 [Gemmatimonadales bacterium]
MSRRRGVLGIFVLLLVSAAGRPSVAAAQDTSDRQLVQRAVAAQEGRYGCVICHKENRRDFAEGVHSAQGIVCHDCHGGDPEALEAEAAHAGDFIGKPTKLETVRICGECHSDPNRMRPFGLPADQAAEMRTSRHGELLFYHDDPNAPTCTDCHDSHTIRPPEDARSDVHPLNIMGTCIACHDDEAIMSQYGIPTGQGEVYRASAHGVGLYEKYNLAAPTCVSCHGSHSALPAAATEVAVCRGCHQEAGSDAVQMGAEIQILAERASQNVRFAEEAIDELQAAGRETDDARFRFRSALTDYHLMGPAQHSLDLETLEDLGRKVSSVSANIRNRAEVMEEQRWEHTLLLVPTWFLALAAVFLATVLVRQGRRDG